MSNVSDKAKIKVSLIRRNLLDMIDVKLPYYESNAVKKYVGYSQSVGLSWPSVKILESDLK